MPDPITPFRRRTRCPQREPVDDRSQGVPRLNALPQFRIEIDGLGIHFLRVRNSA